MLVYYLQAQICPEYPNFTSLEKQGCLELRDYSCEYLCAPNLTTLLNWSLHNLEKMGVLRTAEDSKCPAFMFQQ